MTKTRRNPNRASAGPRIVLVAGARPNFMKVAPVLRALNQHAGACAPILVHTGQHYDDTMSSVFFEQLGIQQPDVCLDAGSGAHGSQTGRIMTAFEEYLLASPTPAGVVVVGDVNSTLACALVSVKLGIPVAHVEAGLRSFDRSMPEEINRVVTDAVSDLLFVSEPSGETNLAREGIAPERVRFVGNVMIDSVVYELAASQALDLPRRLNLPPKAFALVTLHRPSNVDIPEQLHRIVEFLMELSSRMTVVFPVHPRTGARLVEFGLLKCLQRSGIRQLEPLGYREMLALMEQAQFVVTDSGGVQEETTYLGVPCVTLRSSTERPITITQGTNTVVGSDFELARRVIAEIDASTYKSGRPVDGWDGRAATRIADALIQSWQ